MNTLIIHSALTPGGVILQSESSSEKIVFSEGASSSEVLLPAIQNVLENALLTLPQIDAYALTVGPGSFTGIRVGISTLRALSLVHPKPILTISTLQLQASPHNSSTKLIVSAISARQQEVYAALYAWDPEIDDFKVLLPERWIDLPTLFLEMEKFGRSFLAIGRPFEEWRDLIPKTMDVSIVEAWKENYFPESELIQMVNRLKKKAHYVSASELVPEYLRPSEAELRKTFSEQK